MADQINSTIEARRPRGRPRSSATHIAILEAAYTLLEEEGLAGFTIEGVAARAGAAKTTIYRWWPTRETLAVAAFLTVTGPRIAFPDTGCAVADITAQMLRLGAVYRGKTGRVVRDLIVAGHSDPEAASAFVNAYLKPRREAVKTVLMRGIAGGELRAEFNMEGVIDALYGPIFFRLLVGHGPLDGEWIQSVADVVLRGCLADTPSGDPASPGAARMKGSTEE